MECSNLIYILRSLLLLCGEGMQREKGGKERQEGQKELILPAVMCPLSSSWKKHTRMHQYLYWHALGFAVIFEKSKQ